MLKGPEWSTSANPSTTCQETWGSKQGPPFKNTWLLYVGKSKSYQKTKGSPTRNTTPAPTTPPTVSAVPAAREVALTLVTATVTVTVPLLETAVVETTLLLLALAVLAAEDSKADACDERLLRALTRLMYADSVVTEPEDSEEATAASDDDAAR